MTIEILPITNHEGFYSISISVDGLALKFIMSKLEIADLVHEIKGVVFP